MNIGLFPVLSYNAEYLHAYPIRLDGGMRVYISICLRILGTGSQDMQMFSFPW